MSSWFPRVLGFDASEVPSPNSCTDKDDDDNNNKEDLEPGEVGEEYSNEEESNNDNNDDEKEDVEAREKGEKDDEVNDNNDKDLGGNDDAGDYDDISIAIQSLTFQPLSTSYSAATSAATGNTTATASKFLYSSCTNKKKKANTTAHLSPTSPFVSSSSELPSSFAYTSSSCTDDFTPNTSPPMNNNNNNKKNVKEEENHDRAKRIELLKRVQIACIATAEQTMATKSQWTVPDLMFKYPIKPSLPKKDKADFKEMLKEYPYLLKARKMYEPCIGYTPLLVAAHNNNLDAVKVLVEVSKEVSKEYSISCKDCTGLGKTALHVATSLQEKKDNVELVRFLVQWWEDETGVKPVGSNAPLCLAGCTPLGSAYHVYDNFSESNRPTRSVLSQYAQMLDAPGDNSVCLSTPGSTTKRKPSRSFTPKSSNRTIGNRNQLTPLFKASLLSSSSKKKNMNININNGAVVVGGEGVAGIQDLLCIPELEDSGHTTMTMHQQHYNNSNNNNKTVELMCVAVEFQGRRSTFEDSYNISCPLKDARTIKKQEEQQQQEEQTLASINVATNTPVNNTTITNSMTKYNFEEDCALLIVADGHGDNGHISKFVTDKLTMELLSCPAWNQLLRMLSSSCNSHKLGSAGTASGTTIATFVDRNISNRNNLLCHKLIKEAFVDAYLNVEKKLCNGSEPDDRKYFNGGGNGHGKRQVFGGSTCISALVTPKYIYVNNLGDSRAIVIKKSVISYYNDKKMKAKLNSQQNLDEHLYYPFKVTPLSADHKPSLPNERTRIENAGFEIDDLSPDEEITTTAYTYTTVPINETNNNNNNDEESATNMNKNDHYIETNIASITVPAGGGSIKFIDRYDNPSKVRVSRCFGDFECKSNNTNLNNINEQAIIPIPDMFVYERNVLHDMFLVVACDGIYDVMTNDDVGKFLYNKLYEIKLMSDGGTNTNTSTTTTIDGTSIDNNVHVTFDILDKLTHELLQECYHLGSEDNLTAIVCWLGGNDGVPLVPSPKTYCVNDDSISGHNIDNSKKNKNDYDDYTKKKNVDEENDNDGSHKDGAHISSDSTTITVVENDNNDDDDDDTRHNNDKTITNLTSKFDEVI